MDTIKICQHINDLKGLIIEHFDEIMALCDLVGQYQVISISCDTSDSIIFDLEFKSLDDATKLKDSFERIEVSKYGHIFIPSVIQVDAILNVKFIDRLQQVSGL